jgi:hypothetical protein
MARIAPQGPAGIPADGEAPGCWGAIRTDPAHLAGRSAGLSTAETPILASVTAVISPVLAPVASTANASRDDRGCSGDGGGPRNGPASEQTGSANSTSSKHFRLLR